jgi:hypothetical protein
MEYTKFSGSPYEKDAKKAFADLSKRRKTYEDDLKRIKSNLKNLSKKQAGDAVASKKKELALLKKRFDTIKTPQEDYFRLVRAEKKAALSEIEKEERRLAKQKQEIEAGCRAAIDSAKRVFEGAGGIKTVLMGLYNVVEDTVKVLEKHEKSAK